MRTHVRSLAFDLMLRWAAVRGCKRFLIGWNRGLGDIALGLYALVERIRQIVPGASISFVTRPDLYDGMRLLKDVDVQVDPSWVRGRAYAIRKEMQGGFDLVWEKPNPTQWLGWQLGRVTPRLQWQATQDVPCSLLTEEGRYVVGVHLHSETHYGYEKNWPRAKFEQLFAHLQREYAAAILLFGSGRPAEPWEGEGIVDLRGRTSLPQLLSIISGKLDVLIAPDSGILTLTYFLDALFPLRVVSLWADPKQGILKQGVASPNPLLHHTPLIAKQGRMETISVEEVLGAL